MLLILLITALVLTNGVTAHAPFENGYVSQSRSLAEDYLLPGNVIPSLYELVLEPDFETDTFNGSVRISVTIASTTNTIVLHADELDIDESSISLLDESGDVASAVVETSYSGDDRHFYSIVFEDELEEGTSYELNIASFVGILNEDNAGFYLAVYTDEDGVTKKLATTQFEATSARRAFPSFDEPALKAQFEVSIIRSADYHSLSNTALVSTEEISEGRFQDNFERTVTMSTYLVAFIVSDFAYVAAETQRVFGRAESIEAGGGSFPLATGISVLNALADYLDVPYSLSKMDQFAVPQNYFSAGAMENWGLVTYRENYLLFYAEIPCTEIISHEYAHQWFGNLVTMQWWTYLWLNEGFATYFEFYASSLVYQDYDYLNRVVTTSVQYALRRESLSASRPMNQEVGSPSDISGSFDVVAYDKSGSVIRMFAAVFSNAIYQRGLNIYLNNRQYNTAQPSDLYAGWQAALDEAGVDLLPDGEDVASVFSTWDSNAGYPLLTFIRNYDDNSIEISQRKFLTANPNNSDEALWYIPITYTTATSPQYTDHSTKLWLTERSVTTSLDDLDSADWLLVNLQEVGYFRVNYDDENWSRLLSALSEDVESIDKINRAQLYDDSYELAYAGVIDYEIALGFAEYVTRETDYFALEALINKFNALDALLANTVIYEKINLLTWTCKYGSKYCEDFASDNLKKLQLEPMQLTKSNIRTPLNCAMMNVGDRKDWEIVFKLYLDETSMTVQKDLLAVLGCVQKADKINEILSIIFDPQSNFVSSYRLEVFSTIFNSGTVSRNAAFNYVITNWSQIINLFNESQLFTILDQLTFGLSTQEQLDQLKVATLETVPEAILRAPMERAELNVRWTEERLPSVTRSVLIMGTPFHLAVWLFTCLILKTASAQTVASYRLPNTVLPTHYVVALDTSLTTFNFSGTVSINVRVVQATDVIVLQFNFSGTVSINVRVVQATDVIVLHSKDLNITRATVLNANSVNVSLRHDALESTDFLRLWLTSSQPATTDLTINIDFNGELGTGNVGFYRASYINQNGVVRYLAVTHLEPTNARRVFPCFDQPNFKATFQINLKRQQNYITASNTIVTNSLIDGDKIVDAYAITPIMSTYLIAFMVSDYSEISTTVNLVRYVTYGRSAFMVSDYSEISTTVNLVRYVTYGRSELILRGDGGYSLSVAPQAIAGMERFTSYKYILNTMDQVPVPNSYYKIGAMENWGMVTYRERLLMYNNERNTAAEKQSIATIISHELAHQWFGNLVTPQWWRYIWLNEGFATYLEMFITAQIEDSWDLMTQFATSIIQVAMDADALETTRPMSRDAESPEQIEAQYDSIVYEKAGSVIRMAAHFLGDSTFKQGIASYIYNFTFQNVEPSNFTFQNVEPSNLYAALDAVSPANINVTNIMTAWETQAGYPVITVNTGNVAQITQERFFINMSVVTDQTLWPIPLTWLTLTNVNDAVTWLNTRQMNLTLNLNQNDWVIFNVNQIGFYRVNYDANNWEFIRNYLWTARSGRLNHSIALDIGSYITNETEYVPIRTFTKALSHLDRLFTGIDVVHDLVRTYGLTALDGYFNRTGFISQYDDHLTKLTKVEVLTWLCNLGHSGCRNTTRLMFLSWLVLGTPIQPDSQSFVYCNGIRNATIEEWVIAVYGYTIIHEDPQRTRLAAGLGCTQNATILATLLEHVLLADSVFSENDKLAAITSVYTNNDVIGVNTILNWLTVSFNLINQRVENVGTIIKGVSDRITTEAQRALFNTFITQHANSFTAALNTTIIEASDRINSNILWINSTSEEVLYYFRGSAFSVYCHMLLILSCIIYISECLVLNNYQYGTAEIFNPNKLPENVKPSRYELELWVEDDFSVTATFTGTVSITIRLETASNTITLNSMNISYPDNSYTVTLADDEDAEPIQLTLEEVDTYEMIVLTSEEDLQAGVDYILKFENYEGILHDDMSGFYLSSYTNAENETEYIATTQFQTTDARKAFPCFDEPNFKAVFQITINRPEDYISLANTNITTTTSTQDVYSDTPVMSTYLVAFIISKFEGYSSQGGEREQYDVWSQPDARSTAKYAYDIGLLVLDELDEYTGLPYYDMEGVDKMDQIAIPDFSAGAMENWGLVTYRETSLLWDEHQSTNASKQRVATVVAHEFTHMWFGNLVTMNWWEYTWLNEGFARYFQYYITSKVETDWELMNLFVIEQQQVIFGNDGLQSAAALNSKASTRSEISNKFASTSGLQSAAALNSKASTRSEISNKFASTSYSKGASIIRMMVNMLGEEEFHEGIKSYLSTHANLNTVPDDLFTALQPYAPDSLQVPLNESMESWTENAGYPVVTVSRTSEGLSLTQERFLLNSSATSTTKWYVPISYTTQENPDFDNTTITEWMLPTESETLIPLVDSAGWVVVNLQETGYYRVNYHEELWEALREALHADDFDTVIPELNRAQIVDDILNLARANKVEYPLALNVTAFLEKEVSYYPWYSAFQAFLFLRRRIDSTSYVGKTLQTHILTLMKNLYDDVSFTITSSTPHVTVLKTALTLQWACELGLEDCVTEADKLFKDLVDNGADINPNIRSTVYCSALRQAETDTYWNFLWERYQNSRLATEQSIILTALGCSKDEDILKQYLLYSIDSNYIRKQDANTVFSANTSKTLLTFEFLKEHVEDVVNYYEGMNALSSIVTGVADRLTTEALITEFEAFIDEYRSILKDAAVTGDTAIESARANLQWVESNQEELHNWLFDTYGSAGSVTLSFGVLLAGLVVAFLNN
ncbi:Peptidase M1 N-terminal domain [Popillia japonica]|uniref:Aminopeptidase N n=1 Tax=Popillia japonica TaxID=7064 RepID=A0AAW1LQ03_POPJA